MNNGKQPDMEESATGGWIRTLVLAAAFIISFAATYYILNNLVRGF